MNLLQFHTHKLIINILEKLKNDPDKYRVKRACTALIINTLNSTKGEITRTSTKLFSRYIVRNIGNIDSSKSNTSLLPD